MKAQLPDATQPRDVLAEFFPRRISVSVKGALLLSGTPAMDLDWEASCQTEDLGMCCVNIFYRSIIGK